MSLDCVYIINTADGNFCTLLNEECTYAKDCTEPEWAYYSRMVADYEEMNDGQG